MSTWRVRKIREVDRTFVEHLMGSTPGGSPPERAHDLPGFVALRGSDPVGLAVYTLEPEGCELVLLYTAIERIGLGSTLVREVKRAARRAHAARVWVRVPSNAGTLRRFYERNGFRPGTGGQGSAGQGSAGQDDAPTVVLEHPLRAPDTAAL